MKYLFALFLISLFAICVGQKNNDELIISKFENIEAAPLVISFSNSKEVNNSGGHLQGIQLIQVGIFKYVVLSGSSDSYSYCSIVKLGEKNKVVSVNKLMNKPFKHAGGFQVFENYLAVGIEDNEKKDKSKVCIYDISEPENPLVKPLAIINRTGKPKRSTAGCVGITKYKNQILLAVGDWDTKHIDFYSCKFDEIENNCFKSIYTIDTEKQSKENWIDNSWYSYQNINLFTFSNNKLYLIGLGQNNRGEDIADLYSLNEDNSENFSLMKLASKTFNCKNKTSFKAGAGVFLTDVGDFGVVSCVYNIEDISCLNCFSSRILPAHSHNDYEQERPLFDALDSRFKSFEADVFSVGDSLFVAHNASDIRRGRTLRQLYLEPLKEEIKENNGSVYGNGEEIILLVDIKDDMLRTYKLLHKILSDYKNEISVFENGVKTTKSIMVVVSGNRPFDYMQSQAIRYAGFDGRLENLDAGILPALMPVVSDNWAKYFKWNGIGKIPDDEKDRLRKMAGKAKSKGYILRFWNTPNRTAKQRNAVWKELSGVNVGLIGTDNLNELKLFFFNN